MTQRHSAEYYEAAGYCVDRLLLAWAAYLAESSSSGQAFEDLRVACGGVHKAKFFERRGFAKASTESVAQDGVITHQARLPSAILAYGALLSDSAASRDERAMYEEILRALRCQPPPAATNRPMSM